jgi:hypothetical protein
MHIVLVSDSSTHNRLRGWVLSQALESVVLNNNVDAGGWRETVVAGKCMALLCIMSPEFLIPNLQN